jgi:hypothetical protein
LGLCSKRVVHFELAALLAEHFELAWVVVFYDSDSHLSCDWYGTPLHLAHRYAPKPVSALETATLVDVASHLNFVLS